MIAHASNHRPAGFPHFHHLMKHRVGCSRHPTCTLTRMSQRENNISYNEDKTKDVQALGGFGLFVFISVCLFLRWASAGCTCSAFLSLFFLDGRQWGDFILLSLLLFFFGLFLLLFCDCFYEHLFIFSCLLFFFSLSFSDRCQLQSHCTWPTDKAQAHTPLVLISHQPVFKNIQVRYQAKSRYTRCLMMSPYSAFPPPMSHPLVSLLTPHHPNRVSHACLSLAFLQWVLHKRRLGQCFTY